jgi:hypothetical protein
VKPFIGWACFAVALAAIFAFEYAIALIAGAGTCASGVTPYTIVRPCPGGTGFLVAVLPCALFVALGGGIGAGYYLSTWPPLILWAALFVPLGVGFGVVAHGSPDVAVVFYGLCAMFVVMGIVPLFTAHKR